MIPSGQLCFCQNGVEKADHSRPACPVGINRSSHLGQTFGSVPKLYPRPAAQDTADRLIESEPMLTAEHQQVFSGIESRSHISSEQMNATGEPPGMGEAREMSETLGYGYPISCALHGL